MKSTSNKSELAAPTLAQSNKTGINITSRGAPADRCGALPRHGRRRPDRTVLGQLLRGLQRADGQRCRPTGAACGCRKVLSPTALHAFTTGSCRSGESPVDIGQPARADQTRLPGGQPSALCGDENQSLAPVSIPETIRRQGVNPNQIKRGVPVDHRAVPEHGRRRRNHPALGRCAHGPATAQGRRCGSADSGLGTAGDHSRSRRRPAAGSDLLHSRPGG